MGAILSSGIAETCHRKELTSVLGFSLQNVRTGKHTSFYFDCDLRQLTLHLCACFPFSCHAHLVNGRAVQRA